MKIELNRIKKNRTMRRVIEKWGDRKVLIRSQEWAAWWRPNRGGYTMNRNEAGVYTLADALDASAHCGPEKHIFYETVT